ncbi:MAG: hypothetical protein MZU91_02775 [Desulfosudis oleivorans]|nr:hypothetical protein [Desulfosudis oleivorans]
MTIYGEEIQKIRGIMEEGRVIDGKAPSTHVTTSCPNTSTTSSPASDPGNRRLKGGDGPRQRRRRRPGHGRMQCPRHGGERHLPGARRPFPQPPPGPHHGRRPCHAEGGGPEAGAPTSGSATTGMLTASVSSMHEGIPSMAT